MKTKILLTGAGGSLGCAIREVNRNQLELICLDLTPADDNSICPGSFTDAALLDELLPGCQSVIHTAGLHGAHAHSHTPAQLTDVNVAGLVTLLEACVRHGVRRCVFSSTMEIQLGRDWLMSGMAVVDETTTPHPDWIYPANKLLCEKLGAYYFERHGLEFVALRYMALDPVPSVRLLARAIQTNDAARANLQAATCRPIGYEVLNIGPKTPLTNQDISQAMRDAPSVLEKYWPGATETLQRHNIKIKPSHFWPVTRIERASRVLEWQPQVTFETYLQTLGGPLSPL